MRNLITDVAGVRVGHAEDARSPPASPRSSSTQPAVASIDVRGGGPGTRETALLDPAQTVERIDAIALSGGSAFGLDAASGVQAWLREQGRGFAVRAARVPIVPGAILFDLLNGGDKDWGRFPPYRELGYAAAAAAGADFALGSAGAGLGATTVNLKGGLGSASARTRDGITVGALAAVNAAGSVTIGDGPWFWAAPFERDGEFGGRGLPPAVPAEALEFRTKGSAPARTPRSRGRHRRRADQGAGQAARRSWRRTGSRARSIRCTRRSTATSCSPPRPAAGRSPIRCRLTRARRARRQCAGARDRARRLRGDGAALSRRAAELEGPFGG